MTAAAELRALADEVEKLDGPRFEIEQRIGVAIGRPPEMAPHPPYTASLDAAAGLMPSPFRVAALRQLPPEEGGWSLTAWKPPTGNTLTSGRGITEAIARTACALRARAAMEDGRDG